MHALKLDIRHLKTAVHVLGQEEGAKPFFRLPGSSGAIPSEFDRVWLQGFVSNLQAADFTLTDVSGGELMVNTKVLDAPQVQEGSLVTVMGPLKRTKKAGLYVTAHKILVLPAEGTEHQQAAWAREVAFLRSQMPHSATE
ncbi:MAG: hypothetical protein WDW36_009223 [Sanguina aurantia]